MFQLPSFKVPFFGSSSPQSTLQPIKIKSVKSYDIETSPEKRTRTLKHLLRANHANHNILYNELRFHNHAPHVRVLQYPALKSILTIAQILGSAWILGADHDQLNAIYDTECQDLEPWQDSPGEISTHDWRDFLGDKMYTRAYVDFFEDELVKYGYDWESLVHDFLYGGHQPLINCIFAGRKSCQGTVSGILILTSSLVAHPFIHMGYAVELCNREVAMEALGLLTCCYNDSHKYIEDPSYTKPAPNPTTSLQELLSRAHDDKRLTRSDFTSDAEDPVSAVMQNYEQVTLEYWNSWDLSDPTTQLEDCQRLAVALLVGTYETTKRYDFLLVHLLTSSHAMRILLPSVPGQFQVSVLRQWWLFTLTTYLSQSRPLISWESITSFDPHGKTFKTAEHLAVTGTHATDAHYVKGVRAIKVAAETWGDGDDFYLKSAIKFAEGFEGWGF
jgi:hypothetical protein